MSSDSSTLPISPSTLKKANIRFESIVWSKMEDGTQYGRVYIKYFNTDLGKNQDLIIKGGPMATYGVGDNKDSKTKEVTGHSVCLIAPKGGSPFETATGLIHEAACEFLVSHRDECGQSAVVSVDIAKAFLKNPLAHPQKTVDNKKSSDPSKNKRVYVKLVEYKPTENRPAKMITSFDDATSYDPVTKKMTRQIDPLAVRSNVEMLPYVHFDSIYFGSKPSMQIKLPRAAITRELGGNTVASCDEDVGEYMAKMGIVTGPSPVEGESVGVVSQDPTSLL